MFDGCLFVSPRVLIDFWDFEEKIEIMSRKRNKRQDEKETRHSHREILYRPLRKSLLLL